MDNNNEVVKEETVNAEKTDKRTSWKGLWTGLLAVAAIGLLAYLLIPKCSHAWQAATCVEPQTCSLCAQTQGEADAAAHAWTSATCISAKTCALCGAVEGEALGHQWKAATMAEPSKCTVCEAVNPDECSIAAKIIEGTWEICYINNLGMIMSKGNETFAENVVDINFAFSTDGTAYLTLEEEEPFQIPWMFVEESEGGISYAMSDGTDIVNLWYCNDPDSPMYGKMQLDFSAVERLDGPNYFLFEKTSDEVKYGYEPQEKPEDDSATIVIELPERHETDATENALFPELERLMGIDGLAEQITVVRSYEEDIQVRLDNPDFLTQPCVFEMGDGSKLQIPMAYKDLIKAGWKPDDEELSDPIPAQTYLECSFINRSGKTIDVQISNTATEAVALNDAQITMIFFAEEGSEAYSINGITEGATVEEILAVFGMPYDIAYYQLWGGDYTLLFYYRDEAKSQYLQFYIEPETEQLFRVCYITMPDSGLGQ